MQRAHQLIVLPMATSVFAHLQLTKETGPGCAAGLAVAVVITVAVVVVEFREAGVGARASGALCLSRSHSDKSALSAWTCLSKRASRLARLPCA